jgi:hypothetical protein
VFQVQAKEGEFSTNTKGQKVYMDVQVTMNMIKNATGYECEVRGRPSYFACGAGAGEFLPLLVLPLRSVLPLLTFAVAPNRFAAPVTRSRIRPLYISASALCDSLLDR